MELEKTRKRRRKRARVKTKPTMKMKPPEAVSDPLYILYAERDTNDSISLLFSVSVEL